jgi:hypothetical protein
MLKRMEPVSRQRALCANLSELEIALRIAPPRPPWTFVRTTGPNGSNAAILLKNSRDSGQERFSGVTQPLARSRSSILSRSERSVFAALRTRARGRSFSTESSGSCLSPVRPELTISATFRSSQMPETSQLDDRYQGTADFVDEHACQVRLNVCSCRAPTGASDPLRPFATVRSSRSSDALGAPSRYLAGGEADKLGTGSITEGSTALNSETTILSSL